ncbi:hypothetical protein J1N35_027710, partial [Gossypium stocksii]
KIINNIGKDVVEYKVIDPSDDPLSPKSGTLHYGATMIKGNFTAIDGRGFDVHITGVGCLLVYEVIDIIIHGLSIHHCKPETSCNIMGPNGKAIPLGQVDRDAIRVVSARKVWIDHNILYECPDGLLDVTCGSTNVTVSNNWFRDQDKVMLLGHDDGYLEDKNMKVTVTLNYFGPNCNQRMPRVRYGYVHVANNFYQGWEQYAPFSFHSPLSSSWPTKRSSFTVHRATTTPVADDTKVDLQPHSKVLGSRGDGSRFG